MAIEIKRQGLLGKDDSKIGKKKPKTQPGSAPTKPAQGPQTQRPQSRNAKKSQAKKGSGIFKKILQSFFLLLLIGLIVVPKPQLIIYKKLSLVAQSVYLPGWFGAPGKFLDSNQRVIINKSLGLVYLCFSIEQPKEKCNRFQFLEQKGLFSAISHYLDTQSLN
ncbi:MAG: hypothetical protein ACI8WB_001509 [Phenylobacterium sp.]|jgi:hypothetical protein